MAFPAMAKTLHEVGTAIDLGGLARVRLEGPFPKERFVPGQQAKADVEWKHQVIWFSRGMHWL